MVPAPDLALASLRSEACESGEDHAVIRIEIGAMPPLLRSIVSSAIETEGDMAVMAPATAHEGRTGPGAEGADVIVVCSDRDPDACIPVRQLVGSRSAAIVAIDSAGASVTILRVTTESTPIDAASDLRDAVRQAARHRPRTTN